MILDFIWLGTDSGLYRFNGYNYQRFDQNRDLHFSPVNAIKSWRDSLLLIASSGGAYQFSPKTLSLKSWEWQTINNLPEPDTIIDIVVLKEEYLYLLYKSSEGKILLGRCDFAENRAIVWEVDQHTERASQLLLHNKYILIAGDKLIRFDPLKEVFEPIPDDIQNKDCFLVYSNPKSLIFTQQGGVFQLSDNLQLDQVAELEVQVLQAIAIDSQQIYLLTKNQGLLSYIPSRRKVERAMVYNPIMNRYFNYQVPTNFFIDSKENIWFVSKLGLSLYSRAKDVIFEWVAPSNLHNEVQSFRYVNPLFNKKGDRMFATFLGGVRIFQYPELKVLGEVANNGIDRQMRFISAAALGAYNYFLATDGLYRVAIQTDELQLVIDCKQHLERLSSNTFFNGMLVTKDSNIWLVVKDNYFLEYDPRTAKINTYPINPKPIAERIGRDLVYQIIEIDDSTLVILAESGLYYFDKVTRTISNIEEKYKQLIFPDDTQLYGLQYLKMDKIVFCSFGQGIFVYDIRKDSLYQNQNPLLNKLNISDLYVDRNENIWGTSSEGLLFLDVENNTTRIFDSRYGLYDDQLTYHFMKEGPDKKVYLGGINGFNRFDPDQFIALKRYHSCVYSKCAY